MLELLAGPFARALSPVSVPIGIFPQIGNFGYDETVGLFSVLGAGDVIGYSVMELDGTTDGRSISYATGAFIVDLQKNGWATNISDSLYVFDIVNGVPAAVADYVGAPFTIGVAGIQARCIDRYLRFSKSAGVLIAQTASFAAPNTWTTEATFTATSGNAIPFVSRLSQFGSQIVLIFADGQIRVYDTVGKAFSAVNGFLPANIGAFYSPALGIYVVLTGTLATPSVSVYSPNPQPSALSNPSPASGLTTGKVTSVSVTLTGSNSEPCPGELVNWTLVSGSGSIDSLQSTTDSNGVAQVNYVAPTTLGTNPTISASVNF